MAVIHLAFAFKKLYKAAQRVKPYECIIIFMYTVGTVAVFGNLYDIYSITAKEYYKMFAETQTSLYVEDIELNYIQSSKKKI